MDGSDYSGFNMILTFPVGSLDNDTQCLNVSIIDDDTALEGDETFTVTLTLLTTGLGVTTGNTMTTITITDNEGKQLNSCCFIGYMDSFYLHSCHGVASNGGCH